MLGLSRVGQRRPLNKLKPELRRLILHSLCEGMSQRSCERIYRVSNKTVAKLFEEAGDMAISLVASWRDLKIRTIQADELWAFVAAKEKNVEDMLNFVEGAGTVWGYLAMCADTKLVFSYKLGDRSTLDATAFLKDVALKFARAIDGNFAVKPDIVTDGLKAYPQAFQNAFGSDANYAMLVKQYSDTDKNGEPTPRSKYEGAVRQRVQGNVPTADIHTSYIERQNLNLRMGNRRYNRKTNAFSKRLLNHERHLALWMVYHNYCWVPRPVRPTREERAQGKNTWHKRLTAAISAGLTDRLWEIEDLLELTDAYTAKRKELDAGVSAPAEPPKETVDPTAAPFWVYRSFIGQKCKVHAASCCNCRGGQGKSTGSGKTGTWLPFATLAEAKAYANGVDEARSTTCAMCIDGAFRWGGDLRGRAGRPGST